MQKQYPFSTLPPRRVIPDIVPANTSGGRSITSVDQISGFDAGYWQIDLENIPVASRAQKLAWRSLAAFMSGRLNVMDIPTYLGSLAPWPIDADGNYVTPAQALFSDGTDFDDSTSFDDATISATIPIRASLGDVALDIKILDGASALETGMDFSVQGAAYQRLYRVLSIDSVTLGSGFTTYSVTVSPPLREDIPARSVANFEQPRCTCRLADDLQTRSGADAYDGSTLANLSFVEALA